jgi:hypothetical protein
MRAIVRLVISSACILPKVRYAKDAVQQIIEYASCHSAAMRAQARVAGATYSSVDRES